MAIEFDDVKEVLERILVSYGVKSRVELASLLAVPLPTINNWVARESIPGNYIIQCSIETGSDLEWLVTGKLANASFEGHASDFKGKELYDQILASGGKAVLQRIMSAYGFTMQKELGDLLDLSSGTISTWVRRDYFPGDVVVACALDTGVDLGWLATGKGEPFAKVSAKGYSTNILSIPAQLLINGRLEPKGETVIDTNVISTANKDCALITKDSVSWCVNMKEDTIVNGFCLLAIDGVIDVYNVTRLPGNKIKVASSSGDSFECRTEDVSCIGVILKTIN
ncbi:hypothetical protein TUM17576_50310 [Enterobacter hormaechei]|nr:phage repressor protein CI [Enterobacter hormaechei]GJL38211.1 hypothetical protein TUM17576_50310 [Enterobacter hormaechei]